MLWPFRPVLPKPGRSPFQPLPVCATRSLQLSALQKEGRKARQKRQKEALTAEILGQTPVKHVPRTIENTREDDVTFVKAGDEDIAVEEEQDEFAAHFNNERPPHVLLTTCYKCTGVMYKFCADMMVRRHAARGMPLWHTACLSCAANFRAVVCTTGDGNPTVTALKAIRNVAHAQPACGCVSCCQL